VTPWTHSMATPKIPTTDNIVFTPDRAVHVSHSPRNGIQVRSRTSCCDQRWGNLPADINSSQNSNSSSSFYGSTTTLLTPFHFLKIIVMRNEKNIKKRTCLETPYAQIYCEMLGQVCQFSLYDNHQTTPQEVLALFGPLIFRDL
jgi:hypothetical protein